MNDSRPDILNRILARKQQEIDERKARVPQSGLEQRVTDASPTRGFVHSMQQRIDAGESAVIAEVKKASPSKGVIRENFDPVEIAKSYEQGGASCLSVLTDVDFFQGHDDFLVAARSACELPVLRKEFIMEPYQVVESRCLGADCILLIVAALDDAALAKLHQCAVSLGMDVLVEVHDRVELERAMKLDLGMVGINNRDLRSFETSLDTTIGMLDEISSDCLVVTESGIHTAENVALMRSHQVNAFLVGEAFMRVADPGAGLKDLFFS